jgi:hypothetical protein
MTRSLRSSAKFLAGFNEPMLSSNKQQLGQPTQLATMKPVGFAGAIQMSSRHWHA